ncbi:MAG TPA: hypothetical protein DCY08_03740 [Bacteroides stercoris]|nr:hypothetical protein [Bacteroides stercoris]
MATNKNKEKEAAAAQAAPTPETQTAQAAPAPVTEAPAEEKTAAAAKEEKKPKPAASVLEKAGKAAIARHGFKEVFVTSDGQVFPLRSDAQHHAADLTGKEIIKVTE